MFPSLISFVPHHSFFPMVSASLSLILREAAPKNASCRKPSVLLPHKAAHNSSLIVLPSYVLIPTRPTINELPLILLSWPDMFLSPDSFLGLCQIKSVLLILDPGEPGSCPTNGCRPFCPRSTFVAIAELSEVCCCCFLSYFRTRAGLPLRSLISSLGDSFFPWFISPSTDKHTVYLWKKSHKTGHAVGLLLFQALSWPTPWTPVF